ncbi:MAG: DUF4382 domain-containing protein [Flavobacteriaceae bacterium]|nr:DUF4382 domain-containing protein [Flavobacteriaceae bacterium]
MKQQHFIQMVLVIVVMMFLQGCSNDTTQMTRVQIKLVDAPGDYEEVNIDLKDVLINRTESGNGWESIGNVKQGIYNLLEYTGGVEALIADSEIPSGQINQMRLVLGENNSIKINGELTKLDTPSSQQSGLKLNFHTELMGGLLYTFILDFDVNKSIVKAANSGKYNLKPVIRVVAEATSGAIAGKVTPFEFITQVSAINGTDTLRTHTDLTGKFLVKGVPPATYKLLFTPDTSSGFSPKTVENITVTLGNVTDVGTITFE